MVTVPTLDERIAIFLHLWSAASVAEHTGQYAIAVTDFMDAATHALTVIDQTYALEHAFACLRASARSLRPAGACLMSNQRIRRDAGVVIGVDGHIVYGTTENKESE